jgi:hypothetical protein
MPLFVQSGVLDICTSLSRNHRRYRTLCPCPSCYLYFRMRDYGSHRPSFHPVLHRSSHFVQSNVSLPNFSLTALCASHIHVPNSLLLETLGVFLVIQLWKSSAHTQHGYSLPNVVRNDLVSFCNCGVGCVGYVAAIEWRSVQELRPRASTSGGQSDGIANVAARPLDTSAGFAVFLGFVPVMANHEDTSVQVRHLCMPVSLCV